MKRILFFSLALTTTVFADDGVLLQRIVALEQRVAELEEKLAPALEKERVKHVAAEQRNLARERILLDAEFHARLDLNLIEKAYSVANADWKAAEAKRALTLLVEKYPRANRTGCGVLAMAQSTTGDEQMELLNQAITKHASCYYPNGVNVGAYARLYLGMRLKKDDEDEKAAALFAEIKTTFPDAIDHKGNLLISHLKGLE